MGRVFKGVMSVYGVTRDRGAIHVIIVFRGVMRDRGGYTCNYSV